MTARGDDSVPMAASTRSLGTTPATPLIRLAKKNPRPAASHRITVYGAPSASPCVGKSEPWLKLCTRSTPPPPAPVTGVAWAAAFRWNASPPSPARSAPPAWRAERRD
jgi:hypothetical protein